MSHVNAIAMMLAFLIMAPVIVSLAIVLRKKGMISFVWPIVLSALYYLVAATTFWFLSSIFDYHWTVQDTWTAVEFSVLGTGIVAIFVQLAGRLARINK